jgi:hypothetical protein
MCVTGAQMLFMFAVLWIREILVRIRPVQLTSGSESPDRALFGSGLQDANKKYKKICFFAFYVLKVHLYHSSKTESHKELTKQ